MQLLVLLGGDAAATAAAAAAAADLGSAGEDIDLLALADAKLKWLPSLQLNYKYHYPKRKTSSKSSDFPNDMEKGVPCSSSCANVNIVRFEGLYPFRLDQSLFITNGGICVFYLENPRCTQTPTASVIFIASLPSTDPHQRSRPRTSSSLAHWKSSRRFPWKAQLATGELTPQLIYVTHDISYPTVSLNCQDFLQTNSVKYIWLMRCS